MDNPPPKSESVSALTIAVTPLAGIGEVRPGDDLIDHLNGNNALSELCKLPPNDASKAILVIAQKIVSKAEGRLAHLDDFSPSQEAGKLAETTGKDPRIVEAILSESDAVIRAVPGVLIVKDKRGLVLANAGIDRSNIGSDPESILLLPVDPDKSANDLREKISNRFGVSPAIIISDSLGRAWRLGTTNIAIGAAGLPSIIDRSGQGDLHGRTLESTVIGFADSVAAAAGLAMGEAAEGVPAALVTGLDWNGADAPASALLRAADKDLFL